MHDTSEPTVSGERRPTGRNDRLARLSDAVDALTEVNYPGGEFESLIDELGAALREYRSHES